MGTKVQYKSYFPGCSSTRDLNEDADSSWSRYYGDKMFGGHFYNNFSFRAEDGYSEYDKEMLKRTMLEHEAVFRKQVYELHRLYRTQKDMMDEFQKKGSHRYSVPDTSHIFFSSHIPPVGTDMIWKMPKKPAVSNNYIVAPIAVTNNTNPPVNFFKEISGQSSHSPTEYGPCVNDSDMQETKIKKLPRFDLQLPADVYINNEHVDKGKETVAESTFKYTTPNKLYRREPQNDNWTSDLHKQNGPSVHNLADLNKPLGESSCEVVPGSDFIHLLGARTQPEEYRGHMLPVRAPTSSLGSQSAPFKDRHIDGQSFLDFPFADKDRRNQELSFHCVKAGKTPGGDNLFCSGLSNENNLISSKQTQLKFTNSREVHPPNKTDAWLRQKPSLGIEVSGSPCLALLNHSRPAVSGTPCSYLVTPDLDYTCTMSPLVSAPQNPVISICNSTQALPRFSGSETMNLHRQRPDNVVQDSSNASEKRHFNGDLSPCLKLGSEASFYPIGKFGSERSSYLGGSQPGPNSAQFCKLNINKKDDGSAFGNSEGHGPQKRLKVLHYTNAISSVDGSLNQAHLDAIHDGPQKRLKVLQYTNAISSVDGSLNQAHLDAIHDGCTTQRDTGIHAVPNKCQISSENLSWLTGKVSQNKSVDLNKYTPENEIGFSQGYLQVMPKIGSVKSEEEKKGCFTGHRQDVHSTLPDKIRMQSSDAYDSRRSTKILGFPIIENVLSLHSHQEQSVAEDNVRQEKFDLYIASPPAKGSSLETQVPEKDQVQINRTPNIHINLNLTCTDDSCSTELSPIDEARVPPKSTVPSIATEVTAQIDLEAPVTSQEEENVILEEECMPSSKIDGFQQTECSHEALLKEAAENIVRLSVDECSFNGSCLPLPPAPSDTLQWFAEVVSSNMEQDRLSRRGDGCSDDGLDDFESMTLKLKELKADEYCCRPSEPVNRKEGEKDAASLLLARPRRGQARKRRQRRDFQKDILPSLASLSRHEVTEDLRTIGSLMKASGKSWEPGLTRRKTGRKGLQSQARGSRQPRSLAAAAPEIDDSPPKPQPTHAEPEVDLTTMIGWGRTTRRCQRRRCLPVSISTPLT